jgi:hypothetical protein
VISIFDRNERWIPLDIARSCSDHGNIFLQCYSRLASDAIAQGRCAYKLRPKFHEFGHLLVDVLRTGSNPKQRDLFDAEDYIGKIKRVGASCHRRRVDLAVCHKLIMFWLWRWMKRVYRTI